MTPDSDANYLLSGSKTLTMTRTPRCKRTLERILTAQAAGRSASEGMNPWLRIPDSTAMCNDTLASNGPFSKIDDLVVEKGPRIVGLPLPPRFKMDPEENIALRSFLNRNRYLKRGAEYGTDLSCRPPVTNSLVT